MTIYIFNLLCLVLYNILLIKFWNSFVNYKKWPRYDKIPAVIGIVPVVGIVVSLTCIGIALFDKKGFSIWQSYRKFVNYE